MKILEEKGYKYQRHITTGGEGEIHLVKSVDKLFVAKIYDKLDRSSFELLNNLKNNFTPNIPKIHDLFNHEDKTILIRDYVEGNTLFDELKKRGKFNYIDAKSIIIKICTTLRHLHNMKPNPIIYRDLKPENIIITKHNEVRLIDFGIARYHKQESTRDTVLAGTKGYTAPEILAGMQSDNRSDIYSVGLLFYEMITGKNLLEPPYQIRPVKEADASLESWLDVVISKATDLNQTMRYQNIEDFVYDLEHPHKINFRKRFKVFLISAAIIAAAAVLTLAAFKVFSPPKKPFDDTYRLLLDLEFDRPIDKSYIQGIEEFGSEFTFKGDMLFVDKEICTVDFEFARGMAVHYKVRGSAFTSVCAGPYGVDMSGHLDCIFYNPETDDEIGIIGKTLDGGIVNARNGFIDIILYTPKTSHAIYAILIDEDTGQIAYGAFKVPAILNDMLSLDMLNFDYEDGGFLHVDSINVIQGNLLEYIESNFESYKSYEKELNELFEKSVPSLPELGLRPLADIPEFND